MFGDMKYNNTCIVSIIEKHYFLISKRVMTRIDDPPK